MQDILKLKVSSLFLYLTYLTRFSERSNPYCVWGCDDDTSATPQDQGQHLRLSARVPCLSL